MTLERKLSAGRILSRVRTLLVALVLLIFVALAVVPFVYMVILSFIEDGTTMKLTAEYLQEAVWTLDNYKRVISYGNFLRYLLNSAIVSGISCVTTCILSSMAAYAFAKKRFFASNKVYMLYLMTMMVPAQVTLIPLYLQMRDMGLINSYIGIAIPTACGAFGTILLHSFMKGVPDELLEAADIDGCGEIRKFVTIVLPLIKSALVSLTIFTFISTWGSLLWPMLSVTDMDMSVLTVAVTKLKSDNAAVNFGYVMAGTTLSFLPPFVLYIFLQKEFVEGIALSGTKT